MFSKFIVGNFGSKVILAFMWRTLQYYLLFSTYFNNNILKQPKTEKRFIWYALWNMKNAFSLFVTYKIDNNAVSQNLLIFIFILFYFFFTLQNEIKEHRISQ